MKVGQRRGSSPTDKCWCGVCIGKTKGGRWRRRRSAAPSLPPFLDKAGNAISVTAVRNSIRCWPFLSSPSLPLPLSLSKNNCRCHGVPEIPSGMKVLLFNEHYNAGAHRRLGFCCITICLEQVSGGLIIGQGLRNRHDCPDFCYPLRDSGSSRGSITRLRECPTCLSRY